MGILFKLLRGVRNYASAGLKRFGSSIKAYLLKPKLIQTGVERSLYKTNFGELYWLNSTGYIDTRLLKGEIFEEASVSLARKLIKPGDIVLDVGANIGYYSVIFGKLVGNTGRVLAFEPTKHFRDVLEINLKANKLENCEVFGFGLSDKKQEITIQIGESTATIHAPGGEQLGRTETIALLTLDEYLSEFPLTKIDFIKIDVDGHEPFFLKGALKAIHKYTPLILLEISHLHYLEAGVSAWDFYKMLKNEGFRIYREENLKEILTLEEFLITCGNFAYSSNILLSLSALKLPSA